MSQPPALLIATDLDACLLEERSYSFEAARPALRALERRGATLVLCSSKTREELTAIARQIDPACPLVVENGGALVVPALLLPGEPPAGARREGEALVFALGTPRGELLPALAEIAAEAGARVRGFASLGAHEVARLTGLSPEAAARALRREYDEPFLIEKPSVGLAGAVRAAALRRGLRVTAGGRFCHLTGPTDKGRALGLLLRLARERGRRFTTVGLGDSPNDLALLEAVDRPILVPRPGGGLDPALAAALPGAERAPSPGPAGWNAAVLAVLAGESLEPVGPGAGG